MDTVSHYVEFPALGWHIDLSDTLVNFSLFGTEWSIKWYGALIAIGFLLAVIYCFRRTQRFGIDRDRLFDVALVCTLVAFLGARLYYVLFSPSRDEYLADPISILYIWKGGLAIYGGLIGAFLSGLFMCHVRKVNTLAAFDLASLGFLIGQCVGRWGNFFNQEAYGCNTTLPWGMTGDVIQAGTHASSSYDLTLPVHPTFLYESLWCLIGFILLHIVSVKAYSFKGKIFSLYLIWYGAGRFFIESLRTDSLMIGSLRVSQLVAIAAMVAGFALLLWLRSRSQNTPESAAVAEDPDDGLLSTLTLRTDAPAEEADETAEEAAEPTEEAKEAAEEPTEEPAETPTEGDAEES